MKRKTILLLTTLFQLTFAFAQSQLSTDTSVKVLPHWKKGETHSVLIKSSTDDLSNGKTNKYLTTFNAKFSVAEKDTSGYIIEWTYTKATLAPNEVTLENNILANLLDTKFLIKLSLTGRFKELINSDDVKVATDKVIDKLIAGSESNPTMNVQFKAAKQMISTKQGLEVALLKQIKFYNFSFGFNYKTDYPQTNKLKFPNPLGGQPFDAIEKVSLTKLDNSKSICVIETSKNVDGPILKNEVIEYLKKVSKKDSKTIEDELRNENLEFNETSMQQIDFSKGIVQKSNFTRKMNFGFQSRTTSLEIETTD
jgi:hypothetical protein